MRPDGRAPTALRRLTLERGANLQRRARVWSGWAGPCATVERTPRERQGAGGRTHEIQRLVGRSLRTALSGFAFGERTIRVDCDVLQADGGTRTTVISGATVAPADACAWLARSAGVVAEPDRLVEAQGTGERRTFARADLDCLLDLALAGTRHIFAAQRAALSRP